MMPVIIHVFALICSACRGLVAGAWVPTHQASVLRDAGSAAALRSWLCCREFLRSEAASGPQKLPWKPPRSSEFRESRLRNSPQLWSIAER